MPGMAEQTTVDAAEIAHFSAMAADWWNPDGKFAPLHRLGPLRLGFIKEEVATVFGRSATAADALEGLRVLDIGCGGGLVAEPLTRMGATVVGADASPENIGIARAHAAESGLSIDYRATTAEALAAEGERFDVVLALEIVEHVADVPLFVSACGALVKPGGLAVFSTINRTTKAYLLAILGAERVLRWLPPGTHSYDKLVRPAELADAMASAGLTPRAETGVVFDPLRSAWKRSADMDVNYMMAAVKG